MSDLHTIKNFTLDPKETKSTVVSLDDQRKLKNFKL